MMKTLQVGEFKSHFSKVIKDISNGLEVVITYGKRKQKIAVLVPFSKYKSLNRVKLGLLKHKGSLEISDQFKITDQEFLNS